MTNLMNNNLYYTDFLNSSNLPLLIIGGSLTFSIIGILYMSGYIFNNTLSNNDLTNISSDTSGSDTIKTLDTIRISDINDDSIYDTASQNTDVIIENVEYFNKEIQTMNNITDVNIQTDNVKYLDKDVQTIIDIKNVNIQTEEILYNNVNIQTEDIKINNNLIELVNNLENIGNKIYEEAINYSDKLYNIVLDLINKNDELNKLLKKDTIDQGISPINSVIDNTIDQGTSPIKAVIDLNHEELLAKIKELINANTDNNSLLNADALRLTFKDYLESIGKWVDNVNLTTPNTILTPIESLSNIASSSSLSPIIATTVEHISNNSDQISALINLISG